ncbi:unnamed protein product, partial [Oppiella nova]
MSDELTNHLLGTNDDDSDEDNEDVDYNPDKEVVSDNSCSDSEEEDNADDGRKRSKHKDTTDEEVPQKEVLSE